MKILFIAPLVFVLYVPGLSQKYFEGIVEYDLTYEPLSPDVSEEFLTQIFGSKMKFYIKNGSQMREYMDENNNTIRKIISAVPENRVYFITMATPDTITYYDFSDKLFNFYKINRGAKDTVLDCLCPSWSMSYRYYDRVTKDSVSISEEYFFCNKLPVNPDYHKNNPVWYDIIKKEKGVALKFSEEWEGYFKIKYIAKKFSEVTLSQNVFEFDKNVVLINLFKDQ